MKSYKHVTPLKQPTQMSCWTTSMSWFTKAVPSLNDLDEAKIFGMFAHLANNDESIDFPLKYKTFLEDKRWGLTVTSDGIIGKKLLDSVRSPILCGHYDAKRGGHHAVALYKVGDEWWAMDPAYGAHMQVEWLSYYQIRHTIILGYRL